MHSALQNSRKHVMSDDNRSQTVTAGGKAKILAGNTQIEHKPITEFGCGLIFIKSGAFGSPFRCRFYWKKKATLFGVSPF